MPMVLLERLSRLAGFGCGALTLADSPALFELNHDPYNQPAHIMPPMPVSTIPMIQSGQYQM